jgi:hypothetical protein
MVDTGLDTRVHRITPASQMNEPARCLWSKLKLKVVIDLYGDGLGLCGLSVLVSGNGSNARHKTLFE